MVLLDIFARRFSRQELLVAHFNHGIRENADLDADFVQRKAADYGIECRVGEAKLGTGASEAEARTARYEFLKSLGGVLHTAHHVDDLCETVAVNLTRGTGWRGLAVFGDITIKRPFLEDFKALGFATPPRKTEIFRYAGEHDLEFREDQTNSSDEYLRNRIRHAMNNFAEADRMIIYQLWLKQSELRDTIDMTVEEVLPRRNEAIAREWFYDMEDAEAMELLRAATLRAGVKATRPQLRELLVAVREYLPGKYFNLPGNKLVKIRKRDFCI